MNKYVQKIISLILIILITLLTLNYFHIIYFDQMISDVLYFSTIGLMILSSTSIICSKSTNLSKFINYMILLSMFAGLIMYVLTGNLNIIIYCSILLTLISALSDMLYKRA